jgi:NADPH:quinone reductase-like Zn-dependent oxidoreductase
MLIVTSEYGFALPEFPCINGREFVGRVIQQRSVQRPDIQNGNLVSYLCNPPSGADNPEVLSISTDYRDLRKSGFQEYAVVNGFNAVKIPCSLHAAHAASVGVAFVAAALGLGICLGLTFSMSLVTDSPDLQAISQSQDRKDVPDDVYAELFGNGACGRPNESDWILIYGGTSTIASNRDRKY